MLLEFCFAFWRLGKLTGLLSKDLDSSKRCWVMKRKWKWKWINLKNYLLIQANSGVILLRRALTFGIWCFKVKQQENFRLSAGNRRVSSVLGVFPLSCKCIKKLECEFYSKGNLSKKTAFPCKHAFRQKHVLSNCHVNFQFWFVVLTKELYTKHQTKLNLILSFQGLFRCQLIKGLKNKSLKGYFTMQFPNPPWNTVISIQIVHHPESNSGQGR